jgi:hypothetical protein
MAFAAVSQMVRCTSGVQTCGFKGQICVNACKKFLLVCMPMHMNVEDVAKSANDSKDLGRDALNGA